MLPVLCSQSLQLGREQGKISMLLIYPSEGAAYVASWLYISVDIPCSTEHMIAAPYA